jgi:hypothetical protein
MKIYGVGVLKAPGTQRVIHDFEDGPFDTTNPVILAEARKLGLSFKPIEAKPVVKAKRKYTKKAKNG